jgi:DNA-binding transcriptional LysR family regulator
MKNFTFRQLMLLEAVARNSSFTRASEELHLTQPAVSNLNVTNREEILRLLTDKSPDMAIMGTPPKGMPLVANSFMSNPLVVIAPLDHPLAHSGRIPLHQILEESFIVRERGSGTRNAIERFLELRGQRMNTTMEMSRNEAIKHAVMAGLGLGIVSMHTLEMEFKLGRLAVLSVEGFPILKDWYVVHREGKRFSAAAQAFKEFVLIEGGNLIQIPQPLAVGDKPPKRPLK